MEEPKFQLAQCRARKLGLPREKKSSTDSRRSGRLGEDFEADGIVLRLDYYNKQRLMSHLLSLTSEHRWNEAAGVASMLLRSLAWWSHVDVRNRPIFSDVMEILRQVQSGGDIKNKMGKLFNLMYNAQPSYKSLESKKIKGDVQLELALYLHHTGDQEGAYNALRSIVDAPPLRDDAAVNLAYGLILHRMWFELVSEQVTEQKSDGASVAANWQPNGENESVLEGRVGVPASARTGNEVLEVSGDNSDLLDITMGNTVKLERSRKRKRRPEVIEDDEFWENARICIRPDMDWRLFPLRFPYEEPGVEYLVPFTSRAQEVCVEAIRHLQLAISGAPEMTQALIPLVQLLLSLGDIESAHKELEICYKSTKSIIPKCIDALLLESLEVRDVVRIASCYETVLWHNPSSIDAVSSLMRLHDNDEYETEALIQAIANHLDAEPGSVHVWHKLADCLLEVAVHIESGDDGNWDLSPDVVVTALLDRVAWWMKKHFSDKHTASTDLKLLTYKAACAVHIYGMDYVFVKNVLELLRTHKLKSMVAALAVHEEHALCILSSS